MTAAAVLSLDSTFTPSLPAVPAFDPMRFPLSEIDTMARSLLAKEQEAARERMLAGVAAPRGRRTLLKTSGGSEALDRLGQRFEMSGRQLRKIMDVCAAAEADPERFGHLLAEMDRSGTANGPHTKLLRLRDEIRVLGLAPIAGRFRTLVVDPPWCDESVSASQRPPYATMSLAEIAAVPVPGWAEDECHLYLWTTAPFTKPALDILSGWGFTHRTTLNRNLLSKRAQCSGSAR